MEVKTNDFPSRGTPLIINRLYIHFHQKQGIGCVLFINWTFSTNYCYFLYCYLFDGPHRQGINKGSIWGALIAELCADFGDGGVVGRNISKNPDTKVSGFLNFLLVPRVALKNDT